MSPTGDLIIKPLILCDPSEVFRFPPASSGYCKIKCPISLVVERAITYAVRPAKLIGAYPCLALLEDPNDLLFAETALRIVCHLVWRTG